MKRVTDLPMSKPRPETAKTIKVVDRPEGVALIKVTLRRSRAPRVELDRQEQARSERLGDLGVLHRPRPPEARFAIVRS